MSCTIPSNLQIFKDQKWSPSSKNYRIQSIIIIRLQTLQCHTYNNYGMHSPVHGYHEREFHEQVWSCYSHHKINIYNIANTTMSEYTQGAIVSLNHWMPINFVLYNVSIK